MSQNTPQFDFSKVGKATPYRVPEGFFAENQNKLKAQISARQGKQHSPILHWIEYAAAAIVFLTLLLYPMSSHFFENDGQIYAPQEDWSAFAEADIFLGTLNEAN